MDGLHLEVLARTVGARRAVEIGTLGGYSGVCLLRGMPDGRLDTFELEPKNAEVARQSFANAGVAERARIHVGPALEKLREIEGDGPFDLVFIDADKTGYPAYLTWAEEHLRPGGIVLLDNAFGWGGVAAPDSDSTRALAECAERLGRGGRWRATMIPTEEGLAFGVKVR
jgi:caffeoyl-CoA O-methyltransferase